MSSSGAACLSSSWERRASDEGGAGQMARRVSRGVGFTALVAGVVVGCLLLGTYGAILGVLITMVGFQMLTRGVEGAPYIVAGISATAGLAVVAWVHGLSWTDMGLGRSTWVTG